MFKDHGGSERKKIKKIPYTFAPSTRTCNQIRCYGNVYTARIRVRMGKEEEVKLNYGYIAKAKKQIQIIVGVFCVTCGHFEEDKEMSELRKRSFDQE